MPFLGLYIVLVLQLPSADINRLVTCVSSIYLISCVFSFPVPCSDCQSLMDRPMLHVCSSAHELQTQLCDFVVAAANKAVHDHGHFSVGLSGGSVATIISQGLRGRKDIDWSKWHVLYCDERHVPFTSDDSTHAYIKRELLDHVTVPESNIYTIDPSLDVIEAAEDYIAKLRKLCPEDDHPSFDLLLLGIGPDGHTCSLFPGHPALHEKTKSVVPIHDSPKPPPTRITLTFPVLNRAKTVVVVATGSSKADAVKGCLEPESEDKTLPGGRVKPSKGDLHWFMDEGATAKLTRK